MGAFFININFRMNALRKVILKKPYIKPLETALWSFSTGFVFMIVPYLIFIGEDNVCVSRDVLDKKDNSITYQGWCGEN